MCQAVCAQRRSQASLVVIAIPETAPEDHTAPDRAEGEQSMAPGPAGVSTHPLLITESKHRNSQA